MKRTISVEPKEKTMNRTGIFQALRSGRFSALVALVGLGLLLSASTAKANGCALSFPAGAVPLVRSAMPHSADQSFDHQEGQQSNEPASIVGLWHLIYTATYTSNGSYLPVPSPAPSGGFQFLESYKTWHGDGTEFENAFLPPAGGNICFGVWKELKDGSVKLHHIGLMFAGATMPPFQSNVFTVDETDTVASNGKTYTCTFDFKLFDATDVYGTGTPLQEIKGTTAGTRITVD
jgi:hypothetical protein